MAFTFNVTLADPISQVRQYVGDTDSTSVQIQDETITAYLATYSPLKTASRIAYDLSAVYTRKAIVNRFDNQETDYSKVAEAYAALAKRLDSREDVTPGQQAAAPFTPGVIVTGGTSGGYRPSGWAANPSLTGWSG